MTKLCNRLHPLKIDLNWCFHGANDGDRWTNTPGSADDPALTDALKFRTSAARPELKIWNARIVVVARRRRVRSIYGALQEPRSIPVVPRSVSVIPVKPLWSIAPYSSSIGTRCDRERNGGTRSKDQDLTHLPAPFIDNQLCSLWKHSASANWSAGKMSNGRVAQRH